MFRGTLELNFYSLPTSPFKLSLLSLSVSIKIVHILESLLLISILSFCVCVYAILLTYSSIILGKTLYSYFPHHVFIFLPTSYSQFSRKVLSVHLVCNSLIFLREVGHLLLSFGITFETRKLVTEFR